jgi:hypothetical protein
VVDRTLDGLPVLKNQISHSCSSLEHAENLLVESTMGIQHDYICCDIHMLIKLFLLVLPTERWSPAPFSSRKVERSPLSFDIVDGEVSDEFFTWSQKIKRLFHYLSDVI